MAGEAGVNRDFQDGGVAGDKPGGGAGQPQALRIRLRSFSGKTAEGAVQMKSRPSGACGQRLQRKVVVQAATDVAQQTKKSAAFHRREMIGEATAAALDVSCGARTRSPASPFCSPTPMAALAACTR